MINEISRQIHLTEGPVVPKKPSCGYFFPYGMHNWNRYTKLLKKTPMLMS